MSRDSRSFFGELIGDGRPLVFLMAWALAVAGGGALFLSCTGDFLPHDVEFLGMEPATLCGLNECRIVHFMIHDRASFGAVLISLATLYTWLALFPLKDGEGWAWWSLVVSCLSGFGSFLCYLGYGYLDTWHGWATLVLLPIAIFGVWRTRKLVVQSLDVTSGWRPEVWTRTMLVGRALWMGSVIGLIGAGGTIMLVGMTEVFVPSDLAFIGYTRAELDAINPRLIPLIAHDRAGFGGGVFTTGLLLACILWKAKPSRHVWQALTLSGTVGFVVAVGVHYPIGYLDTLHLLPAWLGFAAFGFGSVLCRPFYCQS